MMATMIASLGGWSRGAGCAGGPFALAEASDEARQTVAPAARLTTVWQKCGTFTISGGAQRQSQLGDHSVESVLRLPSNDIRDRAVAGSLGS